MKSLEIFILILVVVFIWSAGKLMAEAKAGAGFIFLGTLPA
jgi:hypothetical protein